MSRTGFVGYGCAIAAPHAMASTRKRNLVNSAFNSHLLDDRPELLNLALEDRVLLGASRAHRLGADFAQPFRGIGMANGRGGLFLQPLDHIARRFGRREK